MCLLQQLSVTAQQLRVTVCPNCGSQVYIHREKKNKLITMQTIFFICNMTLQPHNNCFISGKGTRAAGEWEHF